MFFAGLTINMVSLFALIITLGIVVDDAIVVGEHADFRARRLGEDPVTAAENAARRMLTPVFSATITTVIAFFALVAIGGIEVDAVALKVEVSDQPLVAGVGAQVGRPGGAFEFPAF